MSLTIIRGERPTAHFTILGNELLRDGTLSLRARGLLGLLLSYPPGWKITSDAIPAPEGRDAIRSAMRELEDRGYVVRQRRQDDAGRWTTITVVRDSLLSDAIIPGETPVDNTPSYPPPKTGFQASVFQAVIEELNKKTVNKTVTTRTKEGAPRVCGHCHGERWTPTPHGDLERCTCDGGTR